MQHEARRPEATEHEVGQAGDGMRPPVADPHRPGQSGTLVRLPRVWGVPRLLAAPRPARPDTLARLGSLEVRLAGTPREVRAAQRLRFRVFYQDGPARAGAVARLARLDRDRFDAICDHLVVLDNAAPAPDGTLPVVGTYRLLRGARVGRTGGFYTASEFDLAGVLAAHPAEGVLELGRSCVDPAWRGRRTLELLWAGIAAYVRRHPAGLMIGCASLPGTDPARLAAPLAALHRAAPLPPGWQARARTGRGVPLDPEPGRPIDPAPALRALPPLVRGYLRLGARFGPEAVVDHGFGTTDVLVVLPVEAVAARYLDHFGGTRQAA